VKIKSKEAQGTKKKKKLKS